MPKIAIMGSDGSMGKLVAKQALQEGDMKIVAAFTIDVSPNVGADIGVLANGTELGVKVSPMKEFKTVMQATEPEVLIDFTLPEGTEIFSKWAIGEGYPTVIGTTGLSSVFLAWVKDKVKEKNLTVTISSNYATGMSIFFEVAANLARMLKGWDVEVIETHHHRKRDSPSGTAIRIAEGIANATGMKLEEVAKYGRDKGINPRKLGEKEIGVHAIRAGDIVGDHIVLYGGQGERIELVHRATSRDCFAQGAIKAARFIAKNPHLGRILSMHDVLGI